MPKYIHRSQVINVQKYKRWARLDDATYRDILQRAASCNSSKFLTQRQFETVMGWLETLLWDRADAGMVPTPAGVQRYYWRHKVPEEGMLNSRMRWKLNNLWQLLSDYLPQEERTETYLAGICVRAAGRDIADLLHGGCIQWEKLPQSAALLVMEALKDRLKYAVGRGHAA